MYPIDCLLLFRLQRLKFPQLFFWAFRVQFLYVQPKPMKELLDLQCFLLSPRIPILTRANNSFPAFALKPSLLQFCWRALSLINDIHLFRLTLVWRYFPSAMISYNDLAWKSKLIKFVSPLNLIPTHILFIFVFQ